MTKQLLQEVREQLTSKGMNQMTTNMVTSIVEYPMGHNYAPECVLLKPKAWVSEDYTSAFLETLLSLSKRKDLYVIPSRTGGFIVHILE